MVVSVQFWNDAICISSTMNRVADEFEEVMRQQFSFLSPLDISKGVTLNSASQLEVQELNFQKNLLYLQNRCCDYSFSNIPFCDSPEVPILRSCRLKEQGKDVISVNYSNLLVYFYREDWSVFLSVTLYPILFQLNVVCLEHVFDRIVTTSHRFTPKLHQLYAVAGEIGAQA